jgi:hypothetical protein
MIWRHASTQELILGKSRVCPPRNPNLNILYVSRQVREEFEMLNLRIRILVHTARCHSILNTCLKPGWLHGKQLAIRRYRSTDDDGQLRVDSSLKDRTRRYRNSTYVAESVHIEHIDDFEGLTRYYLVYTFPDSPTATPTTMIEEAADNSESCNGTQSDEKPEPGSDSTVQPEASINFMKQASRKNTT